MKVFLASGVRKSVLEELTFAFGESDFLDLVNFAMVDRFSILLLPSAPPAAPGASWFTPWVLRLSSPVVSLIVQSIMESRAAILLKFLMNLL